MSNLEREFLCQLLAENTRIDGRGFDDMRNLSLRFGNEYGHVEVSLGNTKLIVQMSASVKMPAPERPFEGLFHISTDVSSMASPDFENGRSTGAEEVLVSRMIEKAIRRSNAVDLESLLIVAGKRCWQVRADVHYLNYDGGLVDASCIGVIAGLLHFRRPDTSIDGDKVVVHDVTERPPVPLSILHVPISVSWSFIPGISTKSESDMEDESSDDNDEQDDGAVVALLDATAAEQALRNGEITITVNKDRELCQITKAGGAQLSTATVSRFTQKAFEIAKSVSDLIQKELNADYKRRNHGNLGSNLENKEESAVNER